MRSLSTTRRPAVSTGTVETGDEDDGRGALGIDFAVLASHKLGKFVVDDLDHHLLRLHGSEHACANGFGLHPVAEFLGNLVGHIGIQEGPAHILKGFGDVDFGYLAFTFEYFERPFESF